MLRFGQKIRQLSRVLTGLFAIQVLAASFCLLTPQAHASEMMSDNMQAMQMQSYGAHCDNHNDKTSGHADHALPCTHCDQPDELIQALSFDSQTNVDLPMLALIIAVAQIAPQQTLTHTEVVPTGPPNSASILYQTTQRILI